jgi:hypothetical protein
MAINCPQCPDITFKPHSGGEAAHLAGVHNQVTHNSSNGPAQGK